MANVELHVYPPLSRHMTSQGVGAFVLHCEIGQGETLGDLLVRLEKEDHQAWQDIVDVQASVIRPAVLTILNGTLLSRTGAYQTVLSNGDQIAFRMMYSGG